MGIPQTLTQTFYMLYLHLFHLQNTIHSNLLHNTETFVAICAINKYVLKNVKIL